MYVKRRENGKIMFGALTKEDREFVYKKGDIYAGIDLNLRDNFMCITVKEKGTEGKLHKSKTKSRKIQKRFGKIM